MSRKKRGRDVASNGPRAVMERLLGVCRSAFVPIEAAYPKAAPSQYRLRDCLSAALSILVLKFSSLYQYLACVHDETEDDSSTAAGRSRVNVLRLFGLQRIPSDTTIRRRLDEVCTSYFEGIFGALFQWMDQVQLWSEFHTVHGYVFVALDGPPEHRPPERTWATVSRCGALLATEMDLGDPVSRAFSPMIRKAIYTTNAIESLIASVRRAVHARGHFTSVGAAKKLMYLALREASAKWSAPRHQWQSMKREFVIHFEDRFNPAAGWLIRA